MIPKGHVVKKLPEDFCKRIVADQTGIPAVRRRRCGASGLLGLALLFAPLLLGGCDRLATVQIGRILESPRDYDGKVVVVSGTVTNSLNLVVVKGFMLKDETGEIMVRTSRAVPNVGQTVRVRGQVDQAFSIGDEQVVVITEAAPK